MKSLTTIKQDVLVVAIRNKAMTDSMTVAGLFHKQHKNVLQSIETLDCSDNFSRLNFQPRDYTDDRGKVQPFYQMTKDGFTFLAMGFRGKKAAQFKEDYITAFNRMEEALRRMASSEHQQARLAGKIIRRDFTDDIKIKVEYAKSQGSQNADKYYQLYSKMVNKKLGIESTSHPGTRDRLEILKQNYLAITEEVCRKAIQDGIREGVYYKDIYQIAKGRVENMADSFLQQGLIQRTPAIANTSKQESSHHMRLIA